MFLISSSEDDDGSLCLLVLARVLPPPRVFRCFGVLIGSMFGLPPHEEGPSAARSSVCSSPAAQKIAPLVDLPPLPRRVEGQRLLLCDLGER